MGAKKAIKKVFKAFGYDIIRMSPLNEKTFSKDYHNKIVDVYNAMNDDLSKDLFLTNFEYSITKNFGRVYESLLRKEEVVKENTILSLIKNNLQHQKDEIILLGDGKNDWHAEVFYKSLKYFNINISKICNSATPAFHNIQNISYDELFNFRNAKIVMYSMDAYTQERELIERGIRQDNLYILLKQISEEYFDSDIMVPKKHEVFVDGGVANFETCLDFIKWTKNNYDAIYGFEPDDICFKKAQECIKSKPEVDSSKVHLYNAGCWSKSAKLQFFSDGRGGSSINENANSTIDVIAIDTVIPKDKQVTFIKLDVEGAELEALKGAKETIKRCRPRLAICIYHKPEDILELPLYILSLHSDYKMYIRHYQHFIYENVLLCI